MNLGHIRLTGCNVSDNKQGEYEQAFDEFAKWSDTFYLGVSNCWHCGELKYVNKSGVCKDCFDDLIEWEEDETA